MTHQIVSRYGVMELRDFYQRSAIRGLALATVLHLSLIGSYYLASFLTHDEDRSVVVRIIDYNHIDPPPSILNSQVPPAVSIAAPTQLASKGTPVPVPDAEISPDITIPTQIEMNRSDSLQIFGTNERGNFAVTVPGNIEVDSDPPTFQPIEKPPVAIVNPAPVYPEIPLRAGIEGTVWVRLLVTKEGKTRKAEIIKSDADMFNQASVDAAMKWVFTPAIMNNGPVAVWVSVPFRFRLQGRH